MNTLRYVLFVANEEAEEIASKVSSCYQFPFMGQCMFNDLYPMSTKEIKEFLEYTPEFDGYAIVEAFMPYQQLGVFGFLEDSDIISVNRCISQGVYEPIRIENSSCAFNGRVDLYKDELGWLHPMAGISYLRNKQCMQKDAYIRMMEKLTKQKGECYIKCLEECFQGMLLTEERIKEYGL